MTKGKSHYRATIYEDAFARLYVATNTAMMEYPWIVGRYGESSPTLAAQAEEYILDSAIGDTSVGNGDVLDQAVDIGADAVVCSDVLHDPQTTTENVLDMLTRRTDHVFDGDVLIPLQYSDEITHSMHVGQLADVLSSHGYDVTDHRLLVGGIMDDDASEQIRRCIEVRETVGVEAYLHGLGMGADRRWVTTIRQCPWLLDAFDNSSLVKNFVYRGELMRHDLTWADFPRVRGRNSTMISVQFREAVVDMFTYMIGPHIREEDALDTFEDGVTVADRVHQHREWYRAQDSDEYTVKAPV